MFYLFFLNKNSMVGYNKIAHTRHLLFNCKYISKMLVTKRKLLNLDKEIEKNPGRTFTVFD
jgi:hypothetical protein